MLLVAVGMHRLVEEAADTLRQVADTLRQVADIQQQVDMLQQAADILRQVADIPRKEADISVLPPPAPPFGMPGAEQMDPFYFFF